MGDTRESEGKGYMSGVYDSTDVSYPPQSFDFTGDQTSEGVSANKLANQYRSEGTSS